LALGLIAGFALAGCSGLKTRSDSARLSVSPKGSVGSVAAPGAEKKRDSVAAEAPKAATNGDTFGGFFGAPQATPAPPPAASFLNREMPKIGVILGPGGMKAYAHIGVLREFARARVPIHGIVGVEWGALVGALYAQQGQVNDVEWRAFKLRDQDIPGEGGFLSSRIKAGSVQSLADYLDVAFGSAQIEQNKIDFACPAFWPRSERAGWMQRGAAKEAVRTCLPYPPMFNEAGGSLASPFGLESAVAYLRGRGANVIVVVNVLAQGELLPGKLASEQVGDQVLWSEIRREWLGFKSPSVQYVINVNTSGHPINDVQGRRALLDVGSRAAADTVGRIVNQFGF
jgi:NTE family protein